MKKNNILKISLWVVFFFFWVVSVFAGSGDTTWVRRYDGANHGYDEASALAVDRDGNIFVTGRSEEVDGENFTTMKYNPDGEIIWVSHYKKPGLSGDKPAGIAVDIHGNTYITGLIPISGQDGKFVTIAYNPDGDTLWMRFYDHSNGWDDVNAITVDANSNVYVTGTSQENGPLSISDEITIKYDSNGTLKWISRDTLSATGIAIGVDGAGNVYTSGYRGDKLYAFMTVTKYDNATGDTLWARSYGGYPPRGATDLAIDSSGNVYVTGGGEFFCTTIKYNANGDLIWVDDENASYTAHPKIAVDRCGDVYVTVAVGYSDYKTVKYSSSGELEWTRYYDGPAHDQDEPSDIVVDRFDNVYVTGYSRGNGTYADYATIKYDTRGNELWVKRYNGPGNDYDGASAIAVDDSGNVCVTGYSTGIGTSSDYATIKYFQSPPRYYAPAMIVSWATNGGIAQDSMKFNNFGPDTLFVHLSGPSWVTSITPSDFHIVKCGSTQTVNLTFNGAGFADTFLTGQIEVLSNSGGGGPNFNDTEYVDVNFAVTDTFYLAEFDTCKRGPRLVVSNVGNLGAQSDSAGMFYNGLNYLFDASPVMVTNQVPGYGNKGFSWIQSKADFLPEGHLIKTDYPYLKTTVYIDKFILHNWRVPSESNFSVHWYWLGWTKWSKIIQFDWVPGNLHGALIKNWWTPNLPPKWWMDVSSTAPVGGYFGIAGDWDVTKEFFDKDKGGIIDSLNLVYLRQDIVNSDKYYGGFQFLSAYVKKGATTTNYTTPFAMHVGNNETQIYPFTGYDDDSLWKYMSMPGDFIEQDSAQDMNLFISAVEMLYPDTTTEIGIDYTAIVSDVNLVDFVRQAVILKKVKPGDANGDGKVTVSDVVYKVNYLFKGGPEPWLMYCDDNGDGKVTVSDVVYEVNYLFKGGPPAKFVVGDKPF